MATTNPGCPRLRSALIELPDHGANGDFWQKIFLAVKDARNRLRFVVFCANTPWVYALAEALSREHPTTAISVYDWLTYRKVKAPWLGRPVPEGLTRETWLFPPGHLGAFRRIFSRVTAWRLKRTLVRATGDAIQRTWLIAPYPWLAPPEIPVNFPNLVYYNLDDYALYRRGRAEKTRLMERGTIEQSRLVICLAKRQVIQFQSDAANPEMIRHFPLGVTQELIAPSGEVPIQPATVAYVGNLVDRVDWQLVVEVARSLPGVRFIFAGDKDDVIGSGNRPGWQQWRSMAFRLPNVHHEPTALQAEVGKFYWSAALNWIPYDVNHPFNVASCPTKIMDGLASGRPLLSTAVPECLLYPEHIAVFHSAEDAKRLIQSHLAMLFQDGWKERRASQLAFVRHQLWPERAALLTTWLQTIT